MTLIKTFQPRDWTVSIQRQAAEDEVNAFIAAQPGTFVLIELFITTAGGGAPAPVLAYTV